MPVMSRGFALLQAIQYEMQQSPFVTYQAQGSRPSATRPDGKVINLYDEFGWLRLAADRGAPIDEMWMSGIATGFGFAGGKSVVPLPGMANFYPMDIIQNQLGAMMGMSGGQIKPSVVVLLGGGGRQAGPAAQHVRAEEASSYANVPGIKLVVPHKVYDVKGIMHAAMRDGGAVVYFNYTTEASADIPDAPYVTPIGKANILQEGTDITVAVIPPANLEFEKALSEMQKEDPTVGKISVEYFDPVSLKPFDRDALVKSVKKTGRLLGVTHGHYTADFTAHILAEAAQYVPGAKMRRIAFPDVPGPFSREMIEWLTPRAAQIKDAIQKTARL